MSRNDSESLSRLFRSAQDALLGVFRWTTEQSTGEAKTTADRILIGQEQAIRMMSAMAGVWTEMAKQGVTGPDGVQAFIDRLHKDVPLMGSALPNAESLKQLTELWRSSGEQFIKTMTAMAQGLSGFDDGAASTDPLGAWAGFASSPGFGLTREYQAKLGKTFEAWLEFQKRDVEYRSLLSKAWTASFSAVMQAMSEKAAKGEGPKTARETLELWIGVADDKFVDLFRTDEFSRAQAALMNAMMKLKLQRRTLMEDTMTANDLPTRRELEEAHRMIYLLRKELKAVKRQLKDLARSREEEVRHGIESGG